MLCSWVIVTAGVLLRGRIAECYFQPLRLEQQSTHRASTNGATISTGEDESTESPGWISTVHETGSVRPGLPCRRQTDCGDALVCLSSGTCGCPELTPVLLSDGDDIVCVSPRHLSEPCLSHDECSHGNEYALCLDSLCRCPSHFHIDSGGRLCIPDYQALNPLKATIIPVAFLILGVVILGALGYQRVQNPSGVKAAPARENLTALALENRSGHSSDRHGENTEGLYRDNECGGAPEADNSGSRLHPFAVSTSWCHGTASLHRQRAQSTPRTTGIKAHKETRIESIRECTKHAIPRVLFGRELQSEPSDATKEKLTHKRSPPEATQREAVEASVQGKASAKGGAATATTREKGFSPKRRTSALSTNKPTQSSHAKRGGGSNCCFQPLSPAATDHGKQRDVRESGMSCHLGKGAHDPEIPSGCHARPLKSDKLTEGELQGGASKKIRSASSGVAAPTQLRRVDSAQPPPSQPDPEEQGEDLPCCGPGCGNMHFDGPSVDSLNTFEWRTESCMKLCADEDRERENPCCLRTCSQPIWPCGHVSYKSPCRRARTCETFAVHHGAVKSEAIQASLLKTAALRRVPWIPLANGSERPASGDYSRRLWGAPHSRTASYAAQSTDLGASVFRLCSLARPGTTGEPRYARPTSRRRSTGGRSCQTAPHVTRSARAAQFSNRADS